MLTCSMTRFLSHLLLRVVVVSEGHVGGTRGSGIVSSASDVLWMRGVGGVCEMCMCLARGSLGGDGECWTCVCIWVAVVWVILVGGG